MAADSVTNLNVYNLVRVYKNNFIDSTQNNSESVFEIQHIDGQVGLGSYASQFFTPFRLGGYGVNIPTQNFVDEFETASDGTTYDPRLRYTVVLPGEPWINGEPYNSQWSATGIISRKQVQPLSVGPVNNDGALNYVYMRYADVLLKSVIGEGEFVQEEHQFRDQRRIERFPGPNIKRGWLEWELTLHTDQRVRLYNTHAQSFAGFWPVRERQFRELGLKLMLRG